MDSGTHFSNVSLTNNKKKFISVAITKVYNLLLPNPLVPCLPAFSFAPDFSWAWKKTYITRFPPFSLITRFPALLTDGKFPAFPTGYKLSRPCH